MPERSQLPQPINSQDENYLRLTQMMAALTAYHQRLNAVAQIPLSGYPDELLKLFDGAPLADADAVASARRTMEGFERDMIDIREKFALPNPERWFEAIEADRYPKRLSSQA